MRCFIYLFVYLFNIRKPKYELWLLHLAPRTVSRAATNDAFVCGVQWNFDALYWSGAKMQVVFQALPSPPALEADNLASKTCVDAFVTMFTTVSAD